MKTNENGEWVDDPSNDKIVDVWIKNKKWVDEEIDDSESLIEFYAESNYNVSIGLNVEVENTSLNYDSNKLIELTLNNKKLVDFFWSGKNNQRRTTSGAGLLFVSWEKTTINPIDFSTGIEPIVEGHTIYLNLFFNQMRLNFDGDFNYKNTQIGYGLHMNFSGMLGIENKTFIGIQFKN